MVRPLVRPITLILIWRLFSSVRTSKSSGILCKSKNQLQRQLDLPRGRCCARETRVCRHNLTLRVKRCEGLAAVGEVRMIEQVERFHTELGLQFFAQDIVVFEQGEIEVVLVWSAERVPTEVAKGARCREREALHTYVVIRVVGIDCAGRTSGSAVGIEIRSLSSAVPANLIRSRSRHIIRDANAEVPAA